MRRVIAVLMAAGALAVPATAAAGGWATVELSSTPDKLGAGEPWIVELTILQHGQTPLAGLQPRVTIAGRESGETRVVTARPAGKPGAYRARVVFPAAGTWDYVVDDGFTREHTYPPVRIGDGAAVSTAAAGSKAADDGGPWFALAVAGAAALLLVALIAAMVRRGPATARG